MMSTELQTESNMEVSQAFDFSLPHSRLYVKVKNADVAVVRKTRNQAMYTHQWGNRLGHFRFRLRELMDTCALVSSIFLCFIMNYVRKIKLGIVISN